MRTALIFLVIVAIISVWIFFVGGSKDPLEKVDPIKQEIDKKP